MSTLLGSCFGGLFQIPVRRLYSGKVVHSMMTRQLVTGLPCGEFEEGYRIDYQVPEKEENYEYWGRLIGDNRDATIEDLMAMVEGDKKMAGSKRLRFCLLIIVDRVLVATTQKPRPTLKYFRLAKLMGKCEDPNGVFCKKLRQQTVKTCGFPLALQLVAFQAIPQLLKLVGGDDSVNLLNYPEKALPQHAGVTLAAVQKVEHDPELTVTPMMDISGEREEGWGVWDNEKLDKKVEYMVDFLKEGHLFTKAHCQGGDGGDPLFVYSDKPRTRKRKTPEDCDNEPVLKHQRTGGVSGSVAGVDLAKFEAMESRVDELGSEVSRLAALCEKQGRELKKMKEHIKGKSARKRHQRCKSKVKRSRVLGIEGGKHSPEAEYSGMRSPYDQNVASAKGEDGDDWLGRVGDTPLPSEADVSSPLASEAKGSSPGEVNPMTPGETVMGLVHPQAGGSEPLPEVKVGGSLELGSAGNCTSEPMGEGGSGGIGRGKGESCEDGISPKEQGILDDVMRDAGLSEEKSATTGGEPGGGTPGVVFSEGGGEADKEAETAPIGPTAGLEHETATVASDDMAASVPGFGVVIGKETSGDETEGDGSAGKNVSRKLMFWMALYRQSIVLVFLDSGEVAAVDDVKCGSEGSVDKHPAPDGRGSDEIGSGDDLTDEEDGKCLGDRSVLVLSDSPTALAVRHKPTQDEEELAALLLAKSPLQFADCWGQNRSRLNQCLKIPGKRLIK
ncbi:hypothetical protein F2Q68_00031421 [Brassica cretica]|uniref:DUF1985 domain-containing protein n=1 Tax=Brassica cretica TaxID=69181 RepID=A0A8S9G3S8_BRACR|nr:hypothetical protein F2Q68_00031421 [Brassica cretica]